MRIPLPLTARVLALLLASSATAAAQPPAVPDPQAPPAIRAEDAHGNPAAVLYESGRWTLVGLTDRRHRAELADWLRVLAPTADSARARRYVVVALPRTVPPPFRGSIRGAFRSAGPWTYLLDWGGGEVAAVCGRSLPCLLLVTPERLVGGRFCGPADSMQVERVRVRMARDGHDAPGAAPAAAAR